MIMSRENNTGKMALTFMAHEKTSDSLVWEAEVKGILKAEIARARISHQELANRLVEMGVKTTKASIDNQLSRGTFSAVFLVQCLRAIGRETLRVGPEL